MRSEAGAGGRGWMRARATGKVQLQFELQLPCCLGTGVQDQLGRHEYTAQARPMDRNLILPLHGCPPTSGYTRRPNIRDIVVERHPNCHRWEARQLLTRLPRRPAGAPRPSCGKPSSAGDGIMDVPVNHPPTSPRSLQPNSHCSPEPRCQRHWDQGHLSASG